VAKSKLSYRDLFLITTQFLQFEKRQIRYIIYYTAVVGIIGFASTVMIQFIVNELSFTGQSYPLLLLTFLIIILLLFNTVLQIIRKVIIEYIQQRILIRATFGAVDSLGFSPLNRLEQSRTDLVHRYFDIFAYQKAMTKLLMDGIGVVIFTILGTALVSLYHPFLFTLVLLILIVFLFIITHFFHPALESNYNQSTQKYRISSWLAQVAESRSLFWNSTIHSFVLKQTDKEMTEYLKARQTHFRILVLQQSSLYILKALGAGLFLSVGGALVLTGQMQVGQLVAAEAVLIALLYNIAGFGKTLSQAYDMVTASQKLDQLLNIGESSHLKKGIVDSINCDDGILISGSSSLIQTPLLFRSGDLIRLRGGSAEDRRQLFYLLYGLESHSCFELKINSIEIENLNDQWKRDNILLIDRAIIYNTDLRSNLSLIHDFVPSETQALLTQALSGHSLLEEQSQLTPQARLHVAICRVFFTEAKIILIDTIFQELSSRDKLFYLELFKKHNPDKIILINCDDSTPDSVWSKVILWT
jgi:ABC-type bacteriocin/lantibiotic exporter with double-glycine peptidase domain